jgi:hypothetical protein
MLLIVVLDPVGYGAVVGSPDLLNAHASRRGRDDGKRVVAIVHEVARGRVLWKGLAELLGGPRRGRMRGHRDVDDAPTVMGQDDQHEQQSIRHGGHDEEVRSHDLPDMIRQKRPPRLGRRSSTSGHVRGDRGLADVYAELQEFAVNSRRTPERVSCCHSAN